MCDNEDELCQILNLVSLQAVIENPTINRLGSRKADFLVSSALFDYSGWSEILTDLIISAPEQEKQVSRYGLELSC